MTTRICNVIAREIWDSRGRPTLEVDVELEGGTRGRAIAPAGASMGRGEAIELRDGGDRLAGFGVRRAISTVEQQVAPALHGVDSTDTVAVDARLLALDDDAKKSQIGGNVVTATSMAAAHAAANVSRMPLWRWLSAGNPSRAPLPEIQIFGGGAHAGGRVDIQDFMVIAIGAESYAQALEWTADVYRSAGSLLDCGGRRHGIADEGGYWPTFDSNEQSLEFLVQAIEDAGFVPGADVAIALDVAASELWRDPYYVLNSEQRRYDCDGWLELLCSWVQRYPVVSVEDPCAEHDLDGMRRFTEAVGPYVQVVADDVVVTSAARIRNAAEQGAGNAALIKPNQVGTLTEARAALDATRAAGWGAIASARSGETEDTTIVHLAVGWGLPQLKIGALARGERTAKWNEGLRITEDLRDGGRLPPAAEFPWGRRG